MVSPTNKKQLAILIKQDSLFMRITFLTYKNGYTVINIYMHAFPSVLTLVSRFWLFQCKRKVKMCI